MSKSSVHSGDRRHSYVLGAVLLIITVLIIFVLRPNGSPSTGGTPEDAAPADVATSTSPSSTTDEEFCAEFRRLAESQGQFVSGGSVGEEQLKESADALIGVGIPVNMSLPARSGYFTLVGGVYDSIGLDLDPGVVGAPAAPFEGGDAAFSRYLTQYCPA